MFSDVFLLQIWIFPDVLVDVFVFSFAACWFGDVWCWLLASRWSIMKPPALTFAVSTASGPPSSHVPIWSHLGMDQCLHVYIYIYNYIYISKSKHIYMCVFSGRINIQLMYESYGGQHQFPTQGFLMAFSEYIGIQDTETGIDVCKLSEKNFLRTWAPQNGQETNLGTVMLKSIHWLPSGKLTYLWKVTIFNGKIHYKWSCSIAMLVYQRVNLTVHNWVKVHYSLS